MANLFELLRQREIIDIFIGDTAYGETNGVKIALPYLSGSSLCSLSTMFGYPKIYTWGGNNQSRWTYMDELLKYCIANHKIQPLLSHIFNKKQFGSSFNQAVTTLTHPELDDIYNGIIVEIVNAINNILYFGGNEFKVFNGQFVINKIDAVIKIEAPKIKMINSQYIMELSERANKDINENAYDSAITKCRTLIEEVFCYVIELRDEQPSEKGDIGTLYKQVKSLYGMHADKAMNTRVNTLLSGLEKIISAIAEMRNKGSDAHGLGSKRISIDEHHARLFLNASVALSDFILTVGEKNKKAANNT